MRKLILAWLIIFSMVASWAQTLPKEPVKPQPPPVTKLTVKENGKMLKPDGTEADWRLFFKTTYDPEGKQPLPKGGARLRKNAMYIPTALLEKNSLDDPKSEQYAEFKEYMKAEKPVYSVRANRNGHRHPKNNRRTNTNRKSSTASNKTVKDLRASLKNAEAERDQARSERDTANNDNTALRKENQTLRDENKSLQTRLDDANEKLRNAGLLSTSNTGGTSISTSEKKIVFEGKKWEPAWWNFYGRLPWWPSWFSSSSGLDWNYTSVIAVWFGILVVLLTLIAFLVTGMYRRPKVRIPTNRETLIKGRDWSSWNPRNWKWSRVNIFRRSSDTGGVLGINNPSVSSTTEDSKVEKREQASDTPKGSPGSEPAVDKVGDDAQTLISKSTAKSSARKSVVAKPAT